MTDVAAVQEQSQPETISSPEPTPTPTPTPEPTPAPPPLTAEAFTFREGFSLDQPVMEKFIGLMNDQALTPQQRGQALLELQADLATQSAEGRSQAWNETRQNWQSEVIADKELGGDNLPSTLATIGSLMERFGNDEVRQAFDQTGAGDHPAIVKFLHTLGKQFAEASPTALGSPASGANLSVEDRIFGVKH